MKRIIFLRHLPYIWDKGKYMVNHTDYLALLMLGKALEIDAIIHSTRSCDYISALALNQGCNSKFLVRDERLIDTTFLKPTRFLEEVQQNTDIHGLDNIAIIAGREPLELLGCPPLEHGAFYIKSLHTASNGLTRGSIEDFRQAYPEETQIVSEALDYLY